MNSPAPRVGSAGAADAVSPAADPPTLPGVDASALPASANLPSATERLEQSRQRIRQYFDSRRPRAHSAAATEASDPSPWLEKLRENPLFAGVADAVGGWWSSHPLRTVFVIAETALHEGVAPVARRHPIALAAGAVALGALLYRTRLLRRLLKPALFAGLATQIVTRMIERIPLESVLDAFTRFRAPADAGRPAAGDAATTTPMPDADLPGASIRPPASQARH